MAGSVVNDKNIPVKYDWYQTETHVVITILIKNVENDDLSVEFTENSVNLAIRRAEQPEPNDDLKLDYNLSHPIAPNECSYKITPFKIEIKLKKTEGVRWTKLIGVDGQLKTIQQQQQSQQQQQLDNQALIYPTSSRSGGKNWSAIEKCIEQDEANESPAGEEAINKLLRDIYGKGSDEVKRAMNKSYTESGGTVLSTNWNDIAKGKVDVKPPDGVEFKKW